MIKASRTALFLVCFCTIPCLFLLAGFLSPILNSDVFRLGLETDIPTGATEEDMKRQRAKEAMNRQRLRHQRPHHVILVPFRNREEHLKKFIPWVGPYLTRNFPNDDFSLFVIEQGDNDAFNKGVLVNAGLKEIAKRAPATQCVIMHDVDLVPKFDGVPYNNCSVPTQLGSELEHFNFSIPYQESCGGVISMHLHDWQMVNGMSNDYKGWGGEDDDLFLRLKIRHLLFGEFGDLIMLPTIYRPPKGKGVFTNLEGGATQPNSESYKSNHTDYKNNLKLLGSMTREKERNRYLKDGLSDLEYSILADKLVDLNGTTDFFQGVHITVVGEANVTAALNKTTSEQTS